MLNSVIVIAKEPVAGRVKTRLCPPLSFEQAATLAAAAISDTMGVAASVRATNHLLALDGKPWRDFGPRWAVVGQPTGGLDQRLVAAFDAAGPGPAVLVGMDTPHFLAEQVAVFDFERYDACLGLAPDGGFWAIGFGRPELHADVISGIPMSTQHTGSDQLAALQRRGLSVQMLDPLLDVDTFADARAVARDFPATEFAAAVGAVSARVVA